MKTSPNFRRVLSSATAGDRLVPVLRAYLHSPKFPSFEVPVAGFEERGADGWFHPSTHPLWPERMLYWYLVAPGKMVSEPMDPMGTIAVTLGHFFHHFIQCCLSDMEELEAVEVYVEDITTVSRGSMDGLLRQSGPWPREPWEFKTMHPNKLAKIVDLAAFMELCPGYYAQAQEYLRLSGFTQMRVLIMATIMPFEMKEILVPYNQQFALGIRDKYMRVHQAVADQAMPDPCIGCSPRSKESKQCPARTVCPVALL